MSDENPGASAAAPTPPPPALPADHVPATTTATDTTATDTTATDPTATNPTATDTTVAGTTATDLSKEEVAPASDLKVTDSAEPPAPTDEATASDNLDQAATKEATEKPAESADTEMKDVAEPAPAPAATEEATEKPAESADTEMKDDAEPAPAPAAEDTEKADLAEPGEAKQSPTAAKPATPSSKAKARRKSTGGDAKGRKLNKKASKAKLTHLDAQPGDHYFVKLKGFPQWPAVICDEDMLPQALIKARPVTAARADGTYREDYADGGKRVVDRTYPVMYLHTNEFGWIPNTSLVDLDPETVMDVKMEKMRKDLQEAHQLASEGNSLDYYKGVLQQYQEDLIEKQKAKEAKSQSTPAKKGKKAKAEDDEDVDMEDAVEDEGKGKAKKTKKRKAEESAETPQRSDSVKKPKIKLTLNSTPKTANGTTPKSTASKPVKIKSKKGGSEAEDNKSEKEAAPPKEPELTQEEKHARKKREVLFLRHKLQKGLLTRDQEPKEEEMLTMSDYIAKLESLPDLEVSIIRATKINKVLKAILKLNSIPKEEEFRFKPRSQALLETWNKFLAIDGPATSAGATQPAQAVNGSAAPEASDAKGESKTNGAEEKSAADSEPPNPEEANAPTADEAKAPEAAEVSA